MSSFGRRGVSPEAGLATLGQGGPFIERAPTAPPEAINELRQLCLSRLDPAIVAVLSPDRLEIEVERLMSSLATERRVHLNGREQKELAADLVNDMIGLGPLEPLLEDQTINDIMINGPHRIFVERSGKVVQSTVRFRDTAHLCNVCQRIAAAVGRRVEHRVPAAGAGRPLRLDPQI